MKTVKDTKDDRKLFTTHYNIGHVWGGIRDNYTTYVLDEARAPFVLRKVASSIVTVCYFWAALELDYWRPDTQKGLCGV